MARPLPECLQTARLILRPPRTGDAPALFESYTRDPEVTRHLVWKPHQTVSDAERFIRICIEAWKDEIRTPYVLALHERQDSPIGMLDARDTDTALEFGFVLARKYWGQGLMTEALRMATRTALECERIYRVCASCDVDNIASQRVLEKSGYLREGRLARYTVHPSLSHEPRDCFIYARCR